DRPDYLYFRLYKENCDTGEAVNSIASCVGRSVKQFTFAGTKDKRASTVQQICAHRLPADQLRRTVLHRLWDKRVRISDLEYRSDRLRLGNLRGNRFKVVLRDVPVPIAVAAAAGGAPGSAEAKDVLGQAFDTVKETGFLNYFGLQRFGTREIRTHTVGSAIISSRWKEAVHLILGDAGKSGASASTSAKRPAEDAAEIAAEAAGQVAKVARTASAKDESIDMPPVTKDESESGSSLAGAAEEKMVETQKEDASLPDAVSKGDKGKGGGKGGGKREAVQAAQRLFIETGNAQQALDLMPRSGAHLERCILGALARGLAPAEALQQLPHQAVSLYAHAAQSLVWNAVLSQRIQQFGRQPVVGDLVFADKASGDSANAESADAFEAGEDAGGEDAESEDDGDSFRGLPSVRVLASPEEVAAAKFCDVVLPMPGSEVQYPENMKKAYEEIAEKLMGLRLADFENSTLVPLTGSYRAICVYPGDLTWRAVLPDELNSKSGPGGGGLIESDVGRLLRERPPIPDQNSGSEVLVEVPVEGGCSEDTPEVAQKEQEEPEKAAVVFSCVLPPSAYLTMMLREVMKQSTASSYLSG
ncbi:unnamed protein product, partial [Polarella glacialis]